MRVERRHAGRPIWLLVVLATTASAAAAEPAPIGLGVITNTRAPPSFVNASPELQQQIDLGHAVFNTQFVPAGTENAARRDGVGPLYNAATCDACHNEGARGRGPTGDGPVSESLIVQLESSRLTPDGEFQPDPRYGHVLNTTALPGFEPEGRLRVRFSARSVNYPDGTSVQLRVPQYELTDLAYGPLAADTHLKPRLAPSLFGVGLLDAVPQRAFADDAAVRTAWQHRAHQQLPGRFGWQTESISVRDQTAKAFAREMGVTSNERPHDDCTAQQTACRLAANGGIPEVSDELLDALVAFERTLAVPQRSGGGNDAGAPLPLFLSTGCVACHRPRLPVNLPDRGGSAVIAPYTDLRLHDLGDALADRTADGHVAPTRFRTAPLWGLGYRVQMEHFPTFLHDGRARSIEEAIVWHDGEARAARDAFEHLNRTQRTELLDWLAGL